MTNEDVAIRSAPFPEVIAYMVVGEHILAGDVVTQHPKDGMLYRLWRGATVFGVAVEELPLEAVVTFNPAVGHFRVAGKIERLKPVYKCVVCEDGDNDAAFGDGDICRTCGYDRIPF